MQNDFLRVATFGQQTSNGHLNTKSSEAFIHQTLQLSHCRGLWIHDNGFVIAFNVKHGIKGFVGDNPTYSSQRSLNFSLNISNANLNFQSKFQMQTHIF